MGTRMCALTLPKLLGVQTLNLVQLIMPPPPRSESHKRFDDIMIIFSKLAVFVGYVRLWAQTKANVRLVNLKILLPFYRLL